MAEDQDGGFGPLAQERTRLRERLLAVEERLEAAARRAGRDPALVEIIAVTKGFPPATVVAAVAGGLRRIGENRVQEAGGKRSPAEALIAAEPGLARPIWHLIGHLQRNKVRAALDIFDRIDAVDSLELASVLSRHLIAADRRLPVLVEIKTSSEPTKHGVTADQALDIVPRIAALPGLEVRGLMTMAELGGRPHPAFRTLRNLRDRLAASWPGPPPHLPELSMGMSGDFEAAVEEGATQIRLGAALFGPRPGGADWRPGKAGRASGEPRSA